MFCRYILPLYPNEETPAASSDQQAHKSRDSRDESLHWGEAATYSPLGRLYRHEVALWRPIWQLVGCFVVS